MAVASIPMLQMQVAFVISLLGVYVGWRGVIARMTAFYDLSGAVRYLLYGIVIGVFLALAVDQLILITIVEDSSTSAVSVPLGNLFALSLLIAAVESSLALFLVGRPRVASIRASPPFGWALGLGLGSMQAAYLIVRLFDPGLAPLSPIAGFNPFSVAMAVLIALLAKVRINSDEVARCWLACAGVTAMTSAIKGPAIVVVHRNPVMTFTVLSRKNAA
mgnify:CR=1 FL=1